MTTAIALKSDLKFSQHNEGLAGFIVLQVPSGFSPSNELTTSGQTQFLHPDTKTQLSEGINP